MGIIPRFMVYCLVIKGYCMQDLSKESAMRKVEITSKEVLGIGVIWGGAFCKDSIRAHEGSLGFMVGFVLQKR